MSQCVQSESMPGLIAVSEITPPISTPGDADVDLEVLRSVPKQFEINDEKSANWLVKKIVAARAYAVHVKEWANLETRRAEREEQCLLYLFGRQIESWARIEVTKFNGRRKSVPLPAGTLSFRVQKVHLVVDDEPRLIEWARTNCPDAIQVIEKLVKSPVNEHFATTGELPDGARIEPEKESFRIS